MSSKPEHKNKPNAEAFSKALARIEQDYKTNTTESDFSGVQKKIAETLVRIKRAHETGAAILDLSRLSLIELPEAIGYLIGHLIQLRKLNLSDNKFIVFPSFISQLTQLKGLDLSNNQLTAIPEIIGQLLQLEGLQLSENQLTTLPEAIGQLTQLRLVDLTKNQLTILPEAIGYLTKLQHLYLSNNKLEALPKTIGLLTQLQQLYLSNNKLAALPDTIGLFTQLQELHLSDNQLTFLPESLENLKSLQEIYLHGNSTLDLPVEVLGPTLEDVLDKKKQPTRPNDILNYYFRTRGGKKPLNEAKLILVGRGAVGKTSLVNRLVYNKFTKDEKKTEGINITEWKLRLNNDEEVRLNIWDFGGQEIMHATHQFFLTQRSLYLLVLNGREGGEDEDAEYWLKLITSFGGDSPVIIVLNKIKEQLFDLNRRALQQKYPMISEFIKTDCEDGTGIVELLKIIAYETDRLPDLRVSFPASWFTIKEQLAKMKKNYMNFDEYRAFCDQYGEVEKTAQEALAGHLHRLGIILNYKDDPRLQDTHVLNPHWVTNGIYKILNSDRLAKQQGEIWLHEVIEILDEKIYPITMRRFIIDMMKKFEICFSFPDDETHYLIPELLDKQQPEQAADFQPKTCLNFQYHYSVLPEGLLPRFIVRTHVISEGLFRWRTGVILKFENNYALVKADTQEKKIFVSVSGSTLGRRRLLAIIRSDFERIHHGIHNLQPLEMVPLPVYPHVAIPYQELLMLEQHRIINLPKIIDDHLEYFDVYKLLNSVDLDEKKRDFEKTQYEPRHAVELFYSYSHKDESLRNELETHLKILERQRLIRSWHDRKIEAGDQWKQMIDKNLERADIILILVSADFMASDYCYDIEMKHALERHKKCEARVIPVIVRDVNWKRAPFAELLALPTDGLPVSKWSDRDSAWRNVAEGIERVVEEMRNKSRSMGT